MIRYDRLPYIICVCVCVCVTSIKMYFTSAFKIYIYKIGRIFVFYLIIIIVYLTKIYIPVLYAIFFLDDRRRSSSQLRPVKATRDVYKCRSRSFCLVAVEKADNFIYDHWFQPSQILLETTYFYLFQHFIPKNINQKINNPWIQVKFRSLNLIGHLIIRHLILFFILFPFFPFSPNLTPG